MERDYFGVGEQAAVEVQDGVGPEVAALGHGLKKVRQPPRQPLGVVGAGRQELGEELLRQQLDVLGEHAEHQLHEEVGRLLGRHVPNAHALGQLGKALGHFLRDRLGRLAGFQGLGLGENLAEDIEMRRLGQVVQIEREDDRRLGGKVGVDLETVQIGDDEERRVLQVLA